MCSSAVLRKHCSTFLHVSLDLFGLTIFIIRNVPYRKPNRLSNNMCRMPSCIVLPVPMGVQTRKTQSSLIVWIIFWIIFSIIFESSFESSVQSSLIVWIILSIIFESSLNHLFNHLWNIFWIICSIIFDCLNHLVNHLWIIFESSFQSSLKHLLNHLFNHLWLFESSFQSSLKHLLNHLFNHLWNIFWIIFSIIFQSSFACFPPNLGESTLLPRRRLGVDTSGTIPRNPADPVGETFQTHRGYFMIPSGNLT